MKKCGLKPPDAATFLFMFCLFCRIAINSRSIPGSSKQSNPSSSKQGEATPKTRQNLANLFSEEFDDVAIIGQNICESLIKRIDFTHTDVQFNKEFAELLNINNISSTSSSTDNIIEIVSSPEPELIDESPEIIAEPDVENTVKKIVTNGVLSPEQETEWDIPPDFVEKLMEQHNLLMDISPEKNADKDLESTTLVRKIVNNGVISQQTGNFLNFDITDIIENLAEQHSSLIIRKRFYPDGDNLKTLELIESDSQFEIKFTKHVKDITRMTTEISQPQEDQEESNKRDRSTNGTPENSPKRIKLTLAQKVRMLRNKQKALKILRLKRRQRIIRKQYSTKIKSRGKKQPLQIKKLDETRTDIPALVSFINLKNDPRRKFAENANQKYLTILIDDLLHANIKFEIPLLFEHNQIEFKYVNIIGTIVGVYTNITEKIQLIIDDSTGRINCVVEPIKRGKRLALSKGFENFQDKTKKIKRKKKSRPKKSQPKKSEKKQAQRKKPKRNPLKLKKSDLFKIIEKTDLEFLQMVRRKKKKKVRVLEAASYVMLKAAQPDLVDDYPAKRNLSLRKNVLGRHVSLTGKVYNWAEARVVYAWDLKFITLEEFCVRIETLFQENSANVQALKLK